MRMAFSPVNHPNNPGRITASDRGAFGFGLCGMPVAVALAKKADVIGCDHNAAKIDLYKSGIDPIHKVGNDIIAYNDISGP